MLPEHEGKPWFVTDEWVWDRKLEVGRGVVNENAYERASARDLECQIIEIGNGIRFGPESNPASEEGLITQVEHWLLIEENLNAAPFRDDAEGMPLSDINNVVKVLEHLPNPIHDPIDSNILLQRIGPCQVVVAVVCRPPDQAASHISFAVDRQK